MIQNNGFVKDYEELGVGGGCHTPKKFLKFGQTKGKFCHKWQYLWLLAHPTKFGQFYKNSIFGRFNEHTPPIKVVSRRPWLSAIRYNGILESKSYIIEVNILCIQPSWFVLQCRARNAGLWVRFSPKAFELHFWSQLGLKNTPSHWFFWQVIES